MYTYTGERSGEKKWRWPLASQGERTWKKPTLPTLDLGLLTSGL